MKKAVLCLNVPELAQGGWRDPEVCKKYPGSGFLPFLYRSGNVISAHEIHHTATEDMLLIQEEENPKGLELLEKGAKGAVLFCLESPLFAPLFYDHLPDYRDRFRYQFLFQGGTDPVYFPSFDRNHLRRPDPWSGRRPRFCMVTSNKHYMPYQGIPGWKDSRSWQQAVQFQLHDKRFMTIESLTNLNLLDLYGKGWPEGMNAPEIPAGGKIEKMARYQFGICIENTALSGYVTEKIIDCILAGVIPVYSGAPDIDQFVPEECFLSLEKFKWPSDKQAWEMIQAGQAFLRRAAGKRFSYQDFAERLLARIQAFESAPTPNPEPFCPQPAAP